MKKYISMLVLTVIVAIAGVQAQTQTEEGYITTPDKVRIFYKIVGSGDTCRGAWWAGEFVGVGTRGSRAAGKK